MIEGIKIGFCITGSFCTFEKLIPIIDKLISAGADVTAIISDAVDKMDTRFNKAEIFKKELEEVTRKKVVSTIVEAEPTGPKKLYDVVLVVPCTGNTMAKISNSISDTAVSLAVKSHLRNNRPVVLGVSSNDALGGNAKNIGELLNMKNIYFIPFFQDDPVEKEKSLFFKEEFVIDTIKMALQNKQLQPLLCV